MASDTNRAKCSDCGTQLVSVSAETAARVACPKCGGTRRDIFVSIVDAAVARDGLEMKAKRFGQKKPFVESISRPSHSKSMAKLVHHERLIDRDNNLYQEKATDYESGEIIHEQMHLLSEHVGHGSAKPKKTPSVA